MLRVASKRQEADEVTIKKAYRRLEKIRLLNIAYETVTNPIKRETYDLQRAASSRKSKAKPRSAPRVEVPKEFMMTPLGYPECFVRSLGRRVVVHSRSDDPESNFQSFFASTKLALWWLPEVNNMCRIRKLGSKARGDKRGAAAGRAGGLNMAFDPQKAKTAGAEGSEVRMAPANKGQKASPTCEGALRFESASQRGQYLAFFPPSHLRVVPFLEEAEDSQSLIMSHPRIGITASKDRVLDFLFVDFASMFKFITLEEVLQPIFSAEEAGVWIELAKLQDDEAVKSHFKEVMGKDVWDEHFALESFRLSTVVFCVGILVSLFTLLILCKVHIRAHEQTRPCVMFLILLLANLGGLAVSGFLASFGSYGRAASTLSDLAVEIRDVQESLGRGGCMKVFPWPVLICSRPAWNGCNSTIRMSSGDQQADKAKDRLYTECPNTTHEFLGDSVTARKQEAREAQDTALVLLKQLSGIPQWLTQRTKDCHTPNSKLETLMPV
eukprot:g17966.t1